MAKVKMYRVATLKKVGDNTFTLMNYQYFRTKKQADLVAKDINKSSSYTANVEERVIEDETDNKNKH